MICKSHRRTLLLACVRLLALAGLPVVTGCTRDDPVSVLEVTTTVSPALASIARDTLGVLVTVQVRNPLERSVRVVTRPGRSLRPLGGALGGGAADSWGAGFEILVVPLDSSGPGRSDWLNAAPRGRTFRFAPGQVLSDTFRLVLRATDGKKPHLRPGRFVIWGSWNTNEGKPVEIEVVP